MVDIINADVPLKSVPPMSQRIFILFLILNTINSAISYGCLPSLSTYALLPYGQKAFHYWSVLVPSAYPIALLISLYYKSPSNSSVILLSIVNWVMSIFIFIIAGQSPCPWLADTIQGALMIIITWFFMATISCMLRIIIGNRIKSEWKDEKGMFYYGGTAQLGLFLGTIPVYLFINVFDLFTDRKPCQIYCLS